MSMGYATEDATGLISPEATSWALSMVSPRDLENSSPASLKSIYKSLADNTKSLRLLSFQAPDGVVTGKLEEFDDVKNCTPFIALSYGWGDDLSTQDIELNGSPFPVRRNLYDFLLQARWARHGWAQRVYGDDAANAVVENAFMENPILWDYWWIDAICIDQESVEEEKNHQLSIMSEIYSQAEFVFVWLGMDQEVERQKESLETLIKKGSTLGPQMSNLSTLKKHQDSGNQKALAYTPSVIHRLLENPYWSRLWIVQEFVLAQDLLLCVGSFVVKWKDFRNYILHLGEEFPISTTNLMDQRYHEQSGERDRISGLVQKFAETRCTDPRDKVFGLLGICNTRFKADYSLTAQKVFIGVVKAEVMDISHAEDYDRLLASFRVLGCALDIKFSRAHDIWDNYVCSDSETRQILVRLGRWQSIRGHRIDGQWAEHPGQQNRSVPFEEPVTHTTTHQG
ncbi:hypothetical protein E2P81_ATG01571 [Venturia nashicola]|nr:hypothetical protein E2P81_ATG01571 [Venturia nashicola]